MKYYKDKRNHLICVSLCERYAKYVLVSKGCAEEARARLPSKLPRGVKVVPIGSRAGKADESEGKWTK